MIKTSFETKGNLSTKVVVEDTEEPVEKMSSATIQQNIDLSGVSEVDDESGTMNVSLTGNISTSAKGTVEGSEETDHQSQSFVMDMSITKTTIEMEYSVDSNKMVMKMSSDEETMASLAKSKVLRLFTEDGKEVKIEMTIE